MRKRRSVARKPRFLCYDANLCFSCDVAFSMCRIPAPTFWDWDGSQSGIRKNNKEKSNQSNEMKPRGRQQPSLSTSSNLLPEALPGAIQSGPARTCCVACKCPLASCVRPDLQDFWKLRGCNLWCAACGRFWKGSEVECADAKHAEQDSNAEIE